MKEKVGILSLYRGSYNYGGVLQAYALTRAVEQYGFDAEQILYRKEKSTSYRIRALMKKSPGHLLLRLGQSAQTKLCDRICRVDRSLALRKKAFQAFKEAHIRDSGTVYTQYTIPQTLNRYDCFISGSDQVWNSNVVDDAYFLNFVPDGTRKFSYAASIAGPIPKAQYPQYRHAMVHLDAVSVREDNAVAQLRDIADEHVEWVLDPVLLLSRQEWESVAAGETPEKPYLLCYFLGNDRAYRDLATQYARKNGLQIVTLPYTGNVHSIQDHHFGDEQLYDVGPDRFLALIRNANCVLTDSFHAVAFCHIFQKNFWALRRTAQHSSEGRVESLLRHSGLQTRYITHCKEAAGQMQNTVQPDFTVCETFLAQMQQSSAAYLQKGLLGKYVDDGN